MVRAQAVCPAGSLPLITIDHHVSHMHDSTLASSGRRSSIGFAAAKQIPLAKEEAWRSAWHKRH